MRSPMKEEAPEKEQEQHRCISLSGDRAGEGAEAEGGGTLNRSYTLA